MGWSPTEAEGKLKQFEHYVAVMSQYYNIQGALHLLLGFAILLYLLVSAVRGHKLTVFTKTLLSVLCLLQVVCCANMWLYSSDSYDNCELFLLIMDSVEFTIFIDVALVISYQYFTSANNIFIFS